MGSRNGDEKAMKKKTGRIKTEHTYGTGGLGQSSAQQVAMIFKQNKHGHGVGCPSSLTGHLSKSAREAFSLVGCECVKREREMGAHWHWRWRLDVTDFLGPSSPSASCPTTTNPVLGTGAG